MLASSGPEDLVAGYSRLKRSEESRITVWLSRRGVLARRSALCSRR